LAGLLPSLPSAFFAQTHPGLGIVRLAALLAESESAPEEQELDLLFEQVDAGFLLDTPSAEIWPELARGLMGQRPGKMLHFLREAGALEQILPEVAALYGIPQIADEPASVDLGVLIEAALNDAAAAKAPLSVRFALLVKDCGKADSPKEHLPVHYKHMERGAPRLEQLCDRLAAPRECRVLALQALMECERVHRVSKMRAGPVALMLERNGAFDAPERFEALMMVCACDYHAYPGRAGQVYPKAALLDLARRACVGLEQPEAPGPEALEAVRGARAMAIARVFLSLRSPDK
jgi:tRNA nucleotidyltransferase (CCA-adding enzyme)